jgi:tRNA/tmRNA/rRNA uracil-C5-methylase (TrmA/RlmC/RlmD family)
MIKMIYNAESLTPELQSEIENYINFLMANGLKIKSAFMQFYTGISVPVGGEYIHICGDKFILEKVNNISLQTSPGSFFQTNTKAAELLYSNIKKWIQLHAVESTVLYDIYCGIGSLGLNVTSNNPIVGIECITDAVYDAIHNAKMNGLTFKNSLKK